MRELVLCSILLFFVPIVISAEDTGQNIAVASADDIDWKPCPPLKPNRTSSYMEHPSDECKYIECTSDNQQVEMWCSPGTGTDPITIENTIEPCTKMNKLCMGQRYAPKQVKSVAVQGQPIAVQVRDTVTPVPQQYPQPVQYQQPRPAPIQYSHGSLPKQPQPPLYRPVLPVQVQPYVYDNLPQPFRHQLQQPRPPPYHPVHPVQVKPHIYHNLPQPVTPEPFHYAQLPQQVQAIRYKPQELPTQVPPVAYMPMAVPEPVTPVPYRPQPLPRQPRPVARQVTPEPYIQPVLPTQVPAVHFPPQRPIFFEHETRHGNSYRSNRVQPKTLLTVGSDLKLHAINVQEEYPSSQGFDHVHGPHPHPINHYPYKGGSSYEYESSSSDSYDKAFHGGRGPYPDIFNTPHSRSYEQKPHPFPRANIIYTSSSSEFKHPPGRGYGYHAPKGGPLSSDSTYLDSFYKDSSSSQHHGYSSPRHPFDGPGEVYRLQSHHKYDGPSSLSSEIIPYDHKSTSSDSSGKAHHRILYQEQKYKQDYHTGYNGAGVGPHGGGPHGGGGGGYGHGPGYFPSQHVVEHHSQFPYQSSSSEYSHPYHHGDSSHSDIGKAPHYPEYGRTQVRRSVDAVKHYQEPVYIHPYKQNYFISKVNGGYTNLKRPDRRCQRVGQYMAHKHDSCRYLRCDHGTQTVYDNYGHLSLYTQDMWCPPGLGVAESHLKYRYSGNPCTVPNPACIGQKQEHYGGPPHRH